MQVTVIKGNPKFINNKVAKDYYNNIRKFLLELGVKRVLFDPGAEYTCPPKSDFYVAHSKGVSRVDRCKVLGVHNSVLLGSLDGVIHPVDAEWQKKTKPGEGTPPVEHFLLTVEQKQAIKDMYERTLKAKPKSSGW